MIAEHQACVSSLTWRILQPKEGYLFTFTPGVTKNRLGLRASPIWDDAEHALVAGLQATTSEAGLTIVWRPAALLIFGGLCTWILVLRQRRRALWLAAMPIGLNAVVLLAIGGAQDVRYHFAGYLFGLGSFLFLFVRRSEPATASASPPVSSLQGTSGRGDPGAHDERPRAPAAAVTGP